MSRLLAMTRSWLADDDGATMVEYGLLVAAIALACVGAAKVLGSNIIPLYILNSL
jgi:pilus assembly protein Flp/PilA